MKTLPDKSIDLFLCDLPYGQLDSKSSEWDKPLDLPKFWEQVERLSKTDNTPIIHFCNTRFGIDLINSKPDWFRYDLVWNKQRGVSFLLANKMPMKSHEMIYVFSKRNCFYNRIDIKTEKGVWRSGNRKCKKSTQYNVQTDKIQEAHTGGEDGMRCVLSVLNFDKSCERNGHPTQKPIDLYKWLIERYCPADGTVLDPTAGSFNSIEAARDLGRSAIGIEMNTAFYEKAVAKLNSQPVQEDG